MKRLIVVSGCPGVGKSTTCRLLYKRICNSVWLDGDWCWMIHPTDLTVEQTVDAILDML